MAILPDCLVQDGSGGFLPTPNGVDVTPLNPIAIQLASPTGVIRWYVEVMGTDELSGPPLLGNVDPLTHEVVSPVATVGFSMVGAQGRSFLFRSTVTDGLTPVVTTFGVFTVTEQGTRVVSAGQTLEGNATFGWTSAVNPLIRTGAPILRYDDTLVAPPFGTPTIQGALDAIKGLVVDPTPLHWEMPLFSGVFVALQVVPVRLATRTMELSAFPAVVRGMARTLRLHAVLEGDGTLVWTDISGPMPIIITGATLPVSSPSPQAIVSVGLPVADAPGSIWLTANHLYELTLGASAGTCVCSGAWLTVDYI